MRAWAVAAGLLIAAHPALEEGGSVEYGPQARLLADIALCQGQDSAPWGADEETWNSYLSTWGYQPSSSGKWREKGKDLGRIRRYRAKSLPPLELHLVRGQAGLELAISLIVWKPGDPEPPEPRRIARGLQSLCVPEGAVGCPDGGLLWKVSEIKPHTPIDHQESSEEPSAEEAGLGPRETPLENLLLGVLYRPSEEGEDLSQDGILQEQDSPTESWTEELLLVARVSGDLDPCWQ